MESSSGGCLKRFKEVVIMRNAKVRGGDEIPAGGFHGGDEIPAGGFHGGDEIPAGGFH
jgi:hypothetical protein